MKLIQLLCFSLAMLVSTHAAALAEDHPANPAAAASRFQPADYFAGNPMQVAANEHQHEGDAASTHEESEGMGCKRESKGCCCCKCCDRGDSDKAGMGCMKKSDSERKHEGKEGCGMMKKGMNMEMGDKNEGKAGAGDAHEGHH